MNKRFWEWMLELGAAFGQRCIRVGRREGNLDIVHTGQFHKVGDRRLSLFLGFSENFTVNGRLAKLLNRKLARLLVEGRIRRGEYAFFKSSNVGFAFVQNAILE